MSAKPARKRSNQGNPAAAPVPEPAAVPAVAAAAPAEAASWLESADPRRRLAGKAVLAAVWLYVAALWLLAGDQILGWGIFGPRTPPLP